MSTLRNPSGPLPPSVYWRRRLIVVAILAAILVIVLLIVFRPSAPAAGPAGSATPTPPASVDPNLRCDPAVLELTPVTDKGSYASGQEPLLSMTIVNTGAVACTIDGGTAAQEYVIWSGTKAQHETYWKSSDCQTDSTELLTVLDAGESISTDPFPWNRTRSSASDCDGKRPAVPGGGASYHLEVHLGDAASEIDKQFALN